MTLLPVVAGALDDDDLAMTLDEVATQLMPGHRGDVRIELHSSDIARLLINVAAADENLLATMGASEGYRLSRGTGSESYKINGNLREQTVLCKDGGGTLKRKRSQTACVSCVPCALLTHVPRGGLHFLPALLHIAHHICDTLRLMTGHCD